MIESESRKRSWSAIGLLLLVNLVALSFFYSPGTGDVSIWHQWISQISAFGLVGGFAHSGTDYPPLSFVILAATSRFADVLGASTLLLLKSSLLLFLVGTSICFCWFTRNLVLTAALEFSLVLNSVGLAYLDIYFAPFLIAGLFLLQRGHLNVGFLLYAISCATKWQPLLIAPFVCIYVLSVPNEGAIARDKLKRQILPFALAAVILAIPLVGIFGTAVFDSLNRALTWHRFLSANALNFSWLHTWALHLTQPEKYGSLQDGQIYIFLTRDPTVVWPEKVLFYLSYLSLFVAFLRQKKTFERLILYSILGYMAYFIFNTGVHENHLFLVCCLAWILVFVNSDHLVRGLNFSLAANANLFLFYGISGERFHRVIAGVDITVFFAVANICLFVGLLVHTLKTDGIDLGFVKLQPRHAPTA